VACDERIYRISSIAGWDLVTTRYLHTCHQEKNLHQYSSSILVTGDTYSNRHMKREIFSIAIDHLHAHPNTRYGICHAHPQLAYYPFSNDLIKTEKLRMSARCMHGHLNNTRPSVSSFTDLGSSPPKSENKEYIHERSPQRAHILTCGCLICMSLIWMKWCLFLLIFTKRRCFLCSISSREGSWLLDRRRGCGWNGCGFRCLT